MNYTPEKQNMESLLLEELSSMRKSNELCDVEIMTEGNNAHEAHSVILAAVSPVFKCMLTKDFKEFHTKKIELPDISSKLFAEMLDYIYGVSTVIKNENVMDLFILGDRFQIASLLHECKRYITGKIDTSTCLEIRRLGEKHNHTDLVYHATKYILHHFEEFAETVDFRKLHFNEISEFLEHDELNIEKEENIIDLIYRWIDKDANRESSLYKLLNSCRYSVVSTEFMDKKFSKDKRFKKNPAVKEFTKKVYKTFTGIKKHNNLPKDTLSCFSKSHRLPTQVILLFGGWNGAQTLNKTECYNLKSNDWYINNKLSDPAGGRCYFSLECIKNVIYIIGGYDGRQYLTSVRQFDPLTNRWSYIAPMHVRRCFASAVTVNDELYIISGFDGRRRLYSVEKYSPGSNEWLIVKSINTSRSDAASVNHNGKIYMFGGFSGDSLSSCECYDVEDDHWHYITPMECKRSGACAVSLPTLNKILVLGGFDGSVRVNSMEIYDPQTNKWSYGRPMTHIRSNFTACLVHHEVYAIGGLTGQGTTDSVEIYDIHSQTWRNGGKINDSRAGMQATCLGNLQNLRHYFDEGYKKIKSDTFIKSGSNITENRNVLHRMGSNIQPHPRER